MMCYPSRRISVVTPPAAEPLTLAETKLFLRVDGDDDDTFIATLITATREFAEQYLRRSLINRTLKLSVDQVLESETRLPLGQVSSVESITAIAIDDSSVIVDTDDYYLKAAEDQLMLTQPIYAHHIEVEYVAGYGPDSADIPAPICQGMLLHLASLYDNREGATALPPATVDFLAPFREISL